MEYTKRDSIMVKGLAALCMVVLHLFCRQGEDVFGTPLIWINETTPFVYLFGFFAEICVPLYALSAGYAQELMKEKGTLSFKNNLKRIFKLLRIYWIVLVLFSVLGLIFDKSGSIPGNLSDFIKSIFLLHSYNGAWWFLNTYILLLLIPYRFLFGFINKFNEKYGLMLCFGMEIVWYFIKRMNLLPDISIPVLRFIGKEVVNLISILPYALLGAVLCKNELIERLRKQCDEYFSPKYLNVIMVSALVVVFILVNICHKSVLTGVSAFATFFLFNLWKKPKVLENFFLYLGKHSTVIWLTHMFFYLYLFKDLVLVVKYPLFMLIFMLVLCIFTSYIVNGIDWCMKKICEFVQKNFFKRLKNASC